MTRTLPPSVAKEESYFPSSAIWGVNLWPEASPANKAWGWSSSGFSLGSQCGSEFISGQQEECKQLWLGLFCKWRHQQCWAIICKQIELQGIQCTCQPRPGPYHGHHWCGLNVKVIFWSTCNNNIKLWPKQCPQWSAWYSRASHCEFVETAEGHVIL